MPKLTSLIEYGLYVEDVKRAAEWYQRLFAFPTLLEEGDRLRALQVGERSVLLLFQNRGSISGAAMPTGFIPPHDGSGPVHVAFSMEPDEVEIWAEHLKEHEVGVESTVKWPEGGASFYFRDLDGHLLELITPQQWKFTPWSAETFG